MKKFLVLALVLFAALQASRHWDDLFHPPPAHEAVIVNGSGGTIERVRLAVAGQTFVRERLEPKEAAVFHFKVSRDGTFELRWDTNGGLAERTWRGGFVPRGPLVERHRIVIEDDGAVVYTAQRIVTEPTAGAR